MKKIVLLLVFMVTISSYAQITFSNFQVTQIAKPSNSGDLKYKIRLSNNFYRSHLYTYLSTDNILSSNDILLGTKRVYGYQFANGSVEYTRNILHTNITKEKYYIILKVNAYTFSSPNDYCINMIDDSGNCDPSPAGKPDLKIDPNNMSAFSDCFSCSINVGLLLQRSERHIVNEFGTALNLSQIIVENDGVVSSIPTKIKYYLSINSVLDAGDYNLNSTTNIASIANGNFVNTSQGIDGIDFGNSGAPYGNFTFIMKIDPDNEIDESDETNNIVKFPIKFRKDPFGNKPSPFLDDLKSISNMDKHYTLYIYNFHGELIKKTEINTKNSENESIKRLSNGIYILKSINGARKISINNNN